MRATGGRIALVCAALCAALLPLATAGSVAHAAETAKATRPNILLIISDDQAWSDFSKTLMPSVYSQLVDQGILFRRAYVDTSLCCPSRAQMLTGLYEHDTGVDQNDVPLERPTIVQALHDSGYRTMLAGKYLNSWPCQPRPEFDRWVCVGTPDPSTYSLVNPYMNVDGNWMGFQGLQPDILAQQAGAFIQSTPANQPFFVMYSPTTPHLPADDPRYASMPVSPPRGPDFNSNTMNQGTPQYARRGPLTSDEITTADDEYAPMARSVRGLDDSVNTLLNSLGGRARDTMVIYISDNGYLFGEHRRLGKNDPWEESVNVPMVVRYPAALPASQAFVSHALVQNVDIPATIADMAHIPWASDGRSFLPIVDGKRKSVRSAALIEACRGPTYGSIDCSGLAYDGARVMTPGFEGIVTPRYKYVEYDDGSVQLVDLKHDPEEFRNLLVRGHRSSRQQRLVEGLRRRLATRLHAMMRPKLATTIVTGPGPTVSAHVAAFTFFAPSRTATYRCRLEKDGTQAPWRSCPSGSEVYAGLADGKYTFQVAAVDQAGHVDPMPASRSFTLTTKDGPLDVSLLSHPPAAQTSPDATFTFGSSNGAQTAFQTRLVPWGSDGTWNPWSFDTSATFSGLADGLYWFEVRSKDLAGDVSPTPQSWIFRVDTTGPSVSFVSEPTNPTRQTSAVFRFTVDEALSSPPSCTVDGRSVDCARGEIKLPSVGSGNHTLFVKAKDALGNETVVRYPWLVDRSGPQVSITDGPPLVTSETDATFHIWSSVDPGLFTCRLDDGPLMPCFVAPQFHDLAPGLHTLEAWSYDAALNRSAESSVYTWRVTG